MLFVLCKGTWANMPEKNWKGIRCKIYPIPVYTAKMAVPECPWILEDGDYIGFYRADKIKGKTQDSVVAVKFQIKQGKKEGQAIFYSKNGKPIGFGNYAQDLAEGAWIMHLPGKPENVLQKIHYTKGIMNGAYYQYMPALQNYLSGNFQMGEPIGQWLMHDRKGKILFECKIIPLPRITHLGRYDFYEDLPDLFPMRDTLTKYPVLFSSLHPVVDEKTFKLYGVGNQQGQVSFNTFFYPIPYPGKVHLWETKNELLVVNTTNHDYEQKRILNYDLMSAYGQYLLPEFKNATLIPEKGWTAFWTNSFPNKNVRRFQLAKSKEVCTIIESHTKKENYDKVVLWPILSTPEKIILNSKGDTMVHVQTRLWKNCSPLLHGIQIIKRYTSPNAAIDTLFLTDPKYYVAINSSCLPFHYAVKRSVFGSNDSTYTYAMRIKFSEDVKMVLSWDSIPASDVPTQMEYSNITLTEFDETVYRNKHKLPITTYFLKNQPFNGYIRIEKNASPRVTLSGDTISIAIPTSVKELRSCMGAVKNGKKTGVWMIYNDSLNMKSALTFENGVLHGKAKIEQCHSGGFPAHEHGRCMKTFIHPNDSSIQKNHTTFVLQFEHGKPMGKWQKINPTTQLNAAVYYDESGIQGKYVYEEKSQGISHTAQYHNNAIEGTETLIIPQHINIYERDTTKTIKQKASFSIAYKNGKFHGDCQLQYDDLFIKGAFFENQSSGNWEIEYKKTKTKWIIHHLDQSPENKGMQQNPANTEEVNSDKKTLMQFVSRVRMAIVSLTRIHTYSEINSILAIYEPYNVAFAGEFMFYKNDKLLHHGYLNAHQKTGTWVFYRKNGRKRIEIFFDSSRMTKPLYWSDEIEINFIRLYYPNGKLSCELYGKIYPNYDLKQEHQTFLIIDKILNTWTKDGNPEMVNSNGSFHLYNLDDELEIIGEYKNGLKEGKWLFFQNDSVLNKIRQYKNNLMHGLCFTGNLDFEEYLSIMEEKKHGNKRSSPQEMNILMERYYEGRCVEMQNYFHITNADNLILTNAIRHDLNINDYFTQDSYRIQKTYINEYK